MAWATVGEGSSPLTRGKLRRPDRCEPTARLIPAHAGKTLCVRCSFDPGRAHPRSRGENQAAANARTNDTGSSPLTRGKPRAAGRARPRCRLIPAHAGKTASPRRGDRPRAAHPRSRGENGYFSLISSASAGSSPLTRGKLDTITFSRRFSGLIPAHAGKTSGSESQGLGGRAHPRSRGENSAACDLRHIRLGSSPLTRGKHPVGDGFRVGGGLIPAHAGKTTGRCGRTSRRRAHPRSRGENVASKDWPLIVAGSSPLTRGKPRTGTTPRRPRRAHPRSRGENPGTRSGLWESMGSSPLTRGKPQAGRRDRRRRRLIPAHAGKTSHSTNRTDSCGAHPRSRGENRRRSRRGSRGCRLIPAHAGKTSVLSCLVVAMRAHPRSRGENTWASWRFA